MRDGCWARRYGQDQYPPDHDCDLMAFGCFCDTACGDRAETELGLCSKHAAELLPVKGTA